MEPVTALAVDYVKGKLVERVVGGFKTHVIERWTKHRASAYFEQLCMAVADKADVGESDELDELIDEILQSEASSQVLFDAYRSVCFTRSRDIGPRILALITAE
jgi:hypothetical protein